MNSKLAKIEGSDFEAGLFKIYHWLNKGSISQHGFNDWLTELVLWFADINNLDIAQLEEKYSFDYEQLHRI